MTVDVSSVSKSPLDRYYQIVSPHLGGKKLTSELISQIEGIASVSSQLKSADIDPKQLRESSGSTFFAFLEERVYQHQKDDLQKRIVREHEFLHALTSELIKNLPAPTTSSDSTTVFPEVTKASLRKVLDNVLDNVSPSSSDSTLRTLIKSKELDENSPAVREVLIDITINQYNEFNETIQLIKELAQNPEKIKDSSKNIAKHLIRVGYLLQNERFQKYTANNFFLNDPKLMKDFIDAAFKVFKNTEKIDNMTHEEFVAKHQSYYGYYKNSKEVFDEKLSVLTSQLHLFTKLVPNNNGLVDSIREIAKTRLNFEQGSKFVLKLAEGLQQLEQSTDKNIDVIKDKILNELSLECQLTVENKVVVNSLFEVETLNRKQKSQLQEQQVTKSKSTKEPEKGFWQNWGNLLTIGVGALAFIGSFLTGSEDSKLGKIIAGLGIGAVVGGLVAKFHKSLSGIFGIVEKLPVAAPKTQTATAGGAK